ncbi:MAG: sigma factor, partial [Bacteroidota bacterium]
MHHANNHHLIAHFFRNQYGKMLAVVATYVGLEEAEDIVQETLMTATEHWKLNGTPPNPEAWLYKTARNKTLNVLRRQKLERQYQERSAQTTSEAISFSEEAIADDQLRMM